MRLLKASSLFIILCSQGCADLRKEIAPTPTEQVSNILYIKDSRTGLCFAHNLIYTSPASSDVYVYVPCTPEVEKLLK
jgi:hypothetical protein